MARQLNSTDGAFVFTDTRNTPEVIGSFGIYDPSTARNGFVRFKDILRTYETRLERSEVFTRKLMRVPMDLDQPYWIEDTHFDLEYHIRHIALPKPGDWRQLNILIARLHSHPLDLDRPLWQSYVIEGLDDLEGLPKGCFAHYIKLHHAAVDGMAANEFLIGLHDFKPVFPEGKYGSSVRARKSADKPGKPEMAVRAYTNFLKQQLELTKIATKALPQIRKERKFRKEHGLEKTPAKPQTRFDQPISPNRVYSAMEFPFSKVKEIRAAVPGVTINDLAIAIVSRAVRKYLGDKNELPDESMVAMVPVSLRKQVELKGDAGNSVTALMVKTHTNVEDPLELLKKVNETMSKSKAQRTEVGESLFVQISKSLPSALLSGIGATAAASARLNMPTIPANMVISNVPGSPVPLYFAGAKALKTFGVGILQHGVGLFNVISSYCDMLTISFLACRTQMPDPDVYEKAIRASFDEIYEAAVQPGAAAKKKK